MRTQELIDKLDKQYPGWDLYRTAMRQWAVTIAAEGQSYQGSKPTIDEALAAALAWVPLPLVPPMPTVYEESEFDVGKRGSRWAITRNGNFFFGNYQTKKAATQALSQILEVNSQKVIQWEEEWGCTRQMVEGVDFRYQ